MRAGNFSPKRAILVRIGVDHSYGQWNAPVNPDSMQFVYVPIPEKSRTRFVPGLARSYLELMPALELFCRRSQIDGDRNCRFPLRLLHRRMHLDPDFEYLTYGDRGDRRGAPLADLERGDMLVFYAGLRPIRDCGQRLIYAMVGVFTVDEVTSAVTVAPNRRHENAHTRKLRIGRPDIVVRAKRGWSGRFSRCISIGEWRDGAYRVRRDLLDRWGGLSVRDGFIQRSATLPSFLEPRRFCRWLEKQGVELLARNN
jgi:hypothetical protein